MEVLLSMKISNESSTRLNIHLILILILIKQSFVFLLLQRMACHIQVFALSRWLAVILPVEYFEFARGLQWSIPYFGLPWETGHDHPFMVGSTPPRNPYPYASKLHEPGTFKNVQPQERNSFMDASVYGLPLTPMEYRSFFEVKDKKPLSFCETCFRHY